MKKAQNQVKQAILADFSILANNKKSKMEIYSILANKYGISARNVRRIIGLLANKTETLANNTEILANKTETEIEYPEWFPNELKGQNQEDIPYELWHKYVPEHESTYKSDWHLFLDKYAAWLPPDSPRKQLSLETVDLKPHFLGTRRTVMHYQVSYKDGQYVFIDKNDGRRITHENFDEWKKLYHRACNANVILF